MHFQDKFYPRALQHSFHELLSTGLMCDVTLIADGHEFIAHKLILSAASPYFRVMFNAESSFIESKQDKINLHGVDKVALSDILKFIYTSDIEVKDDNVFALMEAANLLQIHALRAHISFYLQNSLTVENCLRLCVMANLYQYCDLANVVLHFLLINFSKVVDSEDFLELPFEVILQIVSSRLLDVENEETLCEIVLRWIRADIDNRKDYLETLISKINLSSISKEYLTKVKCDSLATFSLKQKIDEVTNYESYNFGKLNIFPKEKEQCFQKVRHKDEKAVIFVIGGESSGMASQSVESFTLLSNDKWSYTVPECIIKRQEAKHTNVLPPLRCARYYAASANDSYNVYVIGGRNSTTLLDECEVFNVKMNQWNYFHKLPVKLFASGAVFLDGELIVVGGFSEEGVLDKVWKLDEIHKTWISMPSLNSPRYFHATVAVGGYIFVLGGYDSTKQTALRTCERFDSSCNKWFEISPMLQTRAKFGVAAVDEYIYVFGGTCDEINCMKSVERYNIFTNEWSYESSMTTPRHSFSVATSDKEIYCIGGSNGTQVLDTVEKFCLRSKNWCCVPSMQISRLAPAAAALHVPYFPHIQMCPSSSHKPKTDT